ncbi:MAG: VOC family protein [Bacteroidetes bacterium]|nr:VOC family protein [Bacteroidota bacterium]MCL5026664.1 VOC family protein [Chloroflexota bacterium]
MLKSFDHVGLTCGNLEKSVAFYRDLLELKEVARGRTASGLDVVTLDAGGGLLELFAAAEPVVTPAAEKPRNVAGFFHLALAVESVDAAYQRLSAAGVEFTVLPRDPMTNWIPTAVNLAFCKDPDGILVELMEHEF